MVTDAQAVQLSPDVPVRRYEDLLRATTAIAGYRDIQTFRERFAEELQRFIAFDYVLVILLDPATQARAPKRSMRATSALMKRSLYEPEGLQISSLKKSLDKPREGPARMLS